VCARADGSAPGPVDGITLSTVGDRVVLRGEFHADAAETLSSAIHAFTPSPTVEDGTTAAQRRAGGLLEVCKVALGRGSEAPRTRPAVSYVTQPREADDPHPMMLGEFTGVIGPRDRDRILCDCDRTEVQVDGAGRPLSVGRSTRTWPVPIRKAIVARDGGCRWPGCDAPAPWCDAHHLVHWEHGGGTSVGNGVLQCPRHHTFLHRHPDWTTTFFEQRFRVFRPDGTEVDPDPWTGLDRGS
jgi:hypothetical protein